ncbi:hypothetical protein BJI46_00605 [Acinetobacter qingfengensis]|uniref:Uncharacterized protein n=2 Tax=Acinetobacter qingfengensis TaxID=1262585 RepID=A0A1E7RFB7_9GAMM|nr:hypothetical protein BJI46_00605 [Acinetobacter qingfengensis]
MKFKDAIMKLTHALLITALSATSFATFAQSQTTDASQAADQQGTIVNTSEAPIATAQPASGDTSQGSTDSNTTHAPSHPQ